MHYIVLVQICHAFCYLHWNVQRVSTCRGTQFHHRSKWRSTRETAEKLSLDPPGPAHLSTLTTVPACSKIVAPCCSAELHHNRPQKSQDLPA